MNRVIKFRAWDPESRTMFEPFDFHLAQETDNGFHAFRFHDNGDFAFLEPMQFTGLHDKHGAEIYEGDILRVKYRCGHDGEYFSDCYFTVSINPLNGLVLTFKCRANNSHPIGEKYENQNSPEGTICAVYGTLSVDFENRNYDRIAIDQRESVFAYSDDIEKVGNIHEHPELLKEAGNE